ncbi:hypothetical protein E2C01_040707 [Portunus trituberculatus]|uniref:Uncharacterized protein n=1 Tax=Portunus trituberculatus TaxID=210409 RepID=A0A5B7FRI1_PORTR|nr:hypothetical protein [Portunus trituberculatus]
MPKLAKLSSSIMLYLQRTLPNTFRTSRLRFPFPSVTQRLRHFHGRIHFDIPPLTSPRFPSRLII